MPAPADTRNERLLSMRTPLFEYVLRGRPVLARTRTPEYKPSAVRPSRERPLSDQDKPPAPAYARDMKFPMLVTAAWLTVFAASGVLAEDAAGWRDAQGKQVPDSDSRKSSKGFGGMILLTPDADWQEKWERPETPRFNTTDKVKTGGNIVALVFFTNPALDKNGHMRILCDIRLTRPDGSVSTDVKDEVCAEGPIQGDLHNVRLVKHLMGFVGEATDAPGVWTFEYELTDAVRDASVTVKASFTYENTANSRT